MFFLQTLVFFLSMSWHFPIWLVFLSKTHLLAYYCQHQSDKLAIFYSIRHVSHVQNHFWYMVYSKILCLFCIEPSEILLTFFCKTFGSIFTFATDIWHSNVEISTIQLLPRTCTTQKSVLYCVIVSKRLFRTIVQCQCKYFIARIVYNIKTSFSKWFCHDDSYFDRFK